MTQEKTEKILAFNAIHHDRRSDKIIVSETVETEDGKIKRVKRTFPVENFYYKKDPTGKSKITDIYGTPMIREVAKDKWALKELAESGAYLCESDIPATTKFLHSRYEGLNLVPKPEYYNIAYLDIELASGDSFTDEDRENTIYPINLITVKFSKTGERYTFGSEPYDGLDNYYWIPDEKKLIEEFIKVFRKNKPDILSGWFSSGFDLPYILNRAKKVLGIDEVMSPFGYDVYDEYRKEWTLGGVAHLDYMLIFQDMKFHQERLPSYKLNAVCMKELGEGKLEFDGELNTLYKTDWRKYVEYNIQDVLLLEKLEKKNKFIDLAINICHKALIPFEQVFSAIAVIEGQLMSFLHAENKVLSNKNKRSHGSSDGEGGYVEAHPGFYENLVSYDYESLYPFIIKTFNVSPEKLVVNPTNTTNLIKTPLSETHGIYYKKEIGVIPKIIDVNFQERKRFKELKKEAERNGDAKLAEFYDSQQKIRKVFLNAIFGVHGNAGFRYFNINLSNTITLSGQHLIKYSRDVVNEALNNKLGTDTNYVVVLDTDSLYINLDPLKKKIGEGRELVEWCNSANEKFFRPLFTRKLNEYFEQFGLTNNMNFKLEKIISQMIIFGKKNYATQVLSNEGIVYDPPKLSVTGFASQRSDRPDFCRMKIKDTLNLFFQMKKKDKEAFTKELREIKRQFQNQPIAEISNPKGIKDYKKYDLGYDYFHKNGLKFLPSTPIHNRAAMVYNYIIRSLNIPRETINGGTKIKYIYVDPRNKYGTNVIGFTGNYPEEFHKLFKIDYTTQFEKTFLSTMQILYDALGWGKLDLYYEEADFIE